MTTKRTFVSLDEELELMEKWFEESKYYKIIKQIKEIGAKEFPSWNTEYGFKTNDLDCLISEYDCGVNGTNGGSSVFVDIRKEQCTLNF